MLNLIHFIQTAHIAMIVKSCLKESYLKCGRGPNSILDNKITVTTFFMTKAQKIKFA